MYFSVQYLQLDKDKMRFLLSVQIAGIVCDPPLVPTSFERDQNDMDCKEMKKYIYLHVHIHIHKDMIDFKKNSFD